MENGMDYGSTLQKLTGSPEQLVKVERLTHEDGSARGTPILAIRNPQGFSFDVLIDRALDIGWADAHGNPIAWRPIQGTSASSRFEPHGNGWTQTFSGGLLTTCGLRSTGAPSTVNGKHYGLHGRIGHIPAQNVHWQFIEHLNEKSIEITGTIIEAGLGEVPLVLNRKIIASTSQPKITISDTVSNAGFQTTGHMFRHHINLGYPLVAPGSTVATNAILIGTRDPVGKPIGHLPWHLELEEHPSPEIVAYFEPNGEITTTVVKSPAGITFSVAQHNEDWPMLILWRDASPGVNVLGVEPATSKDSGRAQAEKDNEIILLEPGRVRNYRTTLTLE